MTEELTDYTPADSIIEAIKAHEHIDKHNDEMTDDEIALVMKIVGVSAPDTTWVDGTPMLGRMGIAVMLTLTLCAFPEFYEAHKLSQFN